MHWVLLFILTINSAGTFSIVAVAPATDEYGVAVASKVFDVGYIVPWIEAEIGAVATQALANPYLGPWLLNAIKQGHSAPSLPLHTLHQHRVRFNHTQTFCRLVIHFSLCPGHII